MSEGTWHLWVCIIVHRGGVINRVTQGFYRGASGLTGKWRSKQSTCTGRQAKITSSPALGVMNRFSPEIRVSFTQLSEMFME